MPYPTYGPLLAPWKVQLIRARAVRMGFRFHEIPDLLQELVPTVAAFRYDPGHRNGASEKTALQALIDNQLKAAHRAKVRYLERMNRLAEEPTAERDNAKELYRQMDLDAVIAMLPEREQAVCWALAAGESCHTVAAIIGTNWHVVRRMIRRIQDHFRVHGLDGYLHA